MHDMAWDMIMCCLGENILCESVDVTLASEDKWQVKAHKVIHFEWY